MVPHSVIFKMPVIMPAIPQSGINMEPDTGKQNRVKTRTFKEFGLKKKLFYR